ncbi:MAG: hypothetical protein ABIW94_10185 [Gemmatimonadaceae bacterium]
MRSQKSDYEAIMLKEWLASRTPPPPPRLAARLDAAVSDVTVNSQDSIPRSLIESASAILRETLAQSNNERNGTVALDLLAADALITYAVEVGAEDCERFAALTGEMIARLSAVIGDGRAEPR